MLGEEAEDIKGGLFDAHFSPERKKCNHHIHTHTHSLTKVLQRDFLNFVLQQQAPYTLYTKVSI